MLKDILVTTAPGLIAAVLMLVACELGFRVGRRFKSGSDDILRSELFTIQAATLALLALLLSFSFSVGANAFESRRQVVIHEAGAIAGAYQATHLLPGNAGPELRTLLVRYIDTRIDLYRGDLLDDASLRARLLESERLCTTIWERATAAAKSEPQSVPAGMALRAIGELHQLNPQRLAALAPTLPPAMLYTLAATAIIAMGWVGCSIGLGARRSVTIPLLLALPFAIILTLILDLDNPRHGIVHVTEESLTGLRWILTRT